MVVEVAYADVCYNVFALRKSAKEYTLCRLQIKFSKTDYLIVGSEGSDLEVEDNTVMKECETYGYLETKRGQSKQWKNRSWKTASCYLGSDNKKKSEEINIQEHCCRKC